MLFDVVIIIFILLISVYVFARMISFDLLKPVYAIINVLIFMAVMIYSFFAKEKNYNYLEYSFLLLLIVFIISLVLSKK